MELNGSLEIIVTTVIALYSHRIQNDKPLWGISKDVERIRHNNCIINEYVSCTYN